MKSLRLFLLFQESNNLDTTTEILLDLGFRKTAKYSPIAIKNHTYCVI